MSELRELNPELNAIVTLAPDVLERARAAEIAVMRGDSGALLRRAAHDQRHDRNCGLAHARAVRRCAWIMFRQTDAPAVARLKAAGAIVLGKTNAAEMAMDYTADNPVFGRTNHPLNPELTPGGSSGGEAVAIATCMSPGGLGSDLAGSVRIPAHFCGICGLKPTTGRVPGELQFPPSIGPYSLGAVIGPMARTAGDLRLLFRALSKDPFERSRMICAAFAWHGTQTMELRPSLRRRRVQLPQRRRR